jgi:signal transduction histidine kinase
MNVLKPLCRPIRCWLLLATLLFSCLVCPAIEPTFNLANISQRQFGLEAGLPYMTVARLFVDDKGLLWVGTEHGLGRFDGRRFEVFDKSNLSIAANYFQAIAQGKDSTLWLGVPGGLYSFREGNLQGARFEGKHWRQNILSILPMDDGRVLVGGPGLYSWDKGTIKQMFLTELPNRWVTVLHQARDKKRLWIGTRNGLACLEEGKLIGFDAQPMLSVYVRSISENRSGELAIGTRNGIFHLDARGKLKRHLLPGLHVRAVVFDQHDALWAGTDGDGIFRWHGKTEEHLDISKGLASNSINALAFDPEGSLWVGTSSSGLIQLVQPKVVTYDQRHGLLRKIVNAVGLDENNRLIAATANGVAVLENDRFRYLDPDSRILKTGAVSILREDSGSLLIGTADGICRMWSERCKELQLPLPDGDRKIKRMLKGSVGELIFATEESLYSWQNNQLQQFRQQDKVGDSSIRVNDLQLGFDKSIVIGDITGLFSAQKYSFSRNPHVPTIWTAGVKAFLQDPDGTFWLATGGSGLGRLRNGKLSFITQSQGLFNDYMHSLIEDSQGFFWAGSAKGISRFRRADIEKLLDGKLNRLPVDVFGQAEGMSSPECMDDFGSPVVRDDQGRLWFATIVGVVMVDPNRLQKNQVLPRGVIQKVVLDLESSRTGPSIIAPPGTKRFDFHVASNSYIAPDRIRFRYRLLGQETSWSEVPRQEVISYSNLAPGDYTFELSSSNNDGVWANETARLQLSVLPHFYQTRLFYLICFLSLATLLYALYSVRIKLLKEQFSSRLEERLAERTRIARELHDTLLQGLVGIGLQLKALSGKVEGHSDASNLIASVSSQVQDTIIEARRSVWQMRSSYLEDGGLFSALRSLARTMESSSGVPIHVETPEEDFALGSDLETDLMKVIGEALSNALRHSRATEIHITVRKDLELLLTTVLDNGHGFDPARAANDGHWGLQGMKERLIKHNGKMEIRSSLSGTAIDFQIPLPGFNGHR